MWICAAFKKLRRILVLAEENNLMLRAICISLSSHRVHGFTIQQTGDSSMLPISPGNSPQFTATPSPAGVKLNSLPTWSTSDETNAPISVDQSGLVATVSIPASAPDQTQFTLTISYQNADGTMALGSISETIVVEAPPVVNVESFTIAQTT